MTNFQQTSFDTISINLPPVNNPHVELPELPTGSSVISNCTIEVKDILVNYGTNISKSEPKSIDYLGVVYSETKYKLKGCGYKIYKSGNKKQHLLLISPGNTKVRCIKSSICKYNSDNEITEILDLGKKITYSFNDKGGLEEVHQNDTNEEKIKRKEERQFENLRKL